MQPCTHSGECVILYQDDTDLLHTGLIMWEEENASSGMDVFPTESRLLRISHHAW